MDFVVGVDGGGTRTTVALADASGAEIMRCTGPAGLVDPRRPTESADTLVGLVRQAIEDAGLTGPARVLCAGLAGVGNQAERSAVSATLDAAGLAERVVVISDGAIALEGAFLGGPGILLVAGTGSVAYGCAPTGTIDRCGGWGMVVGDEGSGFAIGRAALTAALHAVDGRGPETRLVQALLEELQLPGPRAIPPWAGRAAKGEIGALVPLVMRLAEAGDAGARAVVEDAAGEMARHAGALARRLGPWDAEVPVVFFGGVFRNRLYAHLVETALQQLIERAERREPVADSVAGALRYAARSLEP